MNVRKKMQQYRVSYRNYNMHARGSTHAYNNDYHQVKLDFITTSNK